MKRSEAGFTLIEMITVIALIATMLAFSIPNLRDGRVRQNIKEAARQFGADVVFAQSQTLAQHSNNGQVHAFGVYVKKTTGEYTVFEDVNGNQQFDAPPIGPDTIFNQVTLQNDVRLQNISSGNELATQVSDVTIFFAPLADTGAIGSPTCSQPIDCTQKTYFQFKGGNLPDKVNVVLNPSGLIQRP